MHERARAANKAVLVGLDLGVAGYRESLEELRLLAISAGVQIVSVVEGRLGDPKQPCLRVVARWMKLQPLLNSTKRIW